MPKYRAVLFSPDGDWTTDYPGSASVDAVWERLEDQGSRWFFYPYHAVIRDHGRGFTSDRQRLTDAPEVFSEMKGKTIRSFGRMLASLPVAVHEALLN